VKNIVFYIYLIGKVDIGFTSCTEWSW